MTVWWELSVKQHSRTDHNLNTLPIKVAEVLHSSIAQRDHLVIGFALIFLVLYLKENTAIMFLSTADISMRHLLQSTVLSPYERVSRD